MGLVFDSLFILVMRVFFRRIAQTKTLKQILLMLTATVVVSLFLLSPLVEWFILARHSQDKVGEILLVVGASNLVDIALALLFAVLLLLLLTHYAIWPLLTRTLFRMQDIGTKGRRAILVTLGLALFGAAGFHITGVWEKLIESLKG
jgi:hypothetical protein